MQEEIENRTVNLVISMAKLSGRGIVDAGRAFLHRTKGGKGLADRNGTSYKGKQKVKDLVGQGDAVTSVPVHDKRIRDFEQIARRYGVQFSVVKNRGEGNHRYLVFFKAKDTDVLQAVFDEYRDKVLRKKEQERPSVIKQLHRIKEMLDKEKPKIGNRSREREWSR